jgi:hypothetical protein
MPYKGQVRESAQTAEVFQSLLLPGHGEFPRKQQESAAFPAISFILSQVLQATIQHTTVTWGSWAIKWQNTIS